MKRGVFSPYLKCRMDLYNSPDLRELRHDGAAEAFGCLMIIAFDLGRNCMGVGTWEMIGEFAQKCRKSKQYIEGIIKNYGLFDYDDSTFSCRLVSQSFSVESSIDGDGDGNISTRARRADTCAGSAQKDNDNNKNNKKSISGFETVRNGRRYASHGQPLPADAPPQRRRSDMYSYLRHDWVPVEEFDKDAEMIVYKQLFNKETI